MASDTEDGTENIILSSDKMPLFEFLQRYSNRFPQIILTHQNFNGILRSIPSSKLLLVSHLVKQRRYLLKSKTHGLISIPENCPIVIDRSNVFGRVLKKERFCDYAILPKKEKSQKIKFHEPLDDLLISNQLVDPRDLGSMTLYGCLIEELLIVHPLKKDVVNFDPMAIPVDANLVVQVLKGHKEMSHSDWIELLKNCKLVLDRHYESPEEQKIFFISEDAFRTKQMRSRVVSQSYMQPSRGQTFQAFDHKQGIMKIAGVSNPADETGHGVMQYREEGRIHNDLQGAGKMLSVNFREPRATSSYYNQYYSKNEHSNHSTNNNSGNSNTRVVHRSPDQFNAGQRPNSDQKGARIQEKSAIKSDSRRETFVSAETRVGSSQWKPAVAGSHLIPAKINGLKHQREIRSYETDDDNNRRTAVETCNLQITDRDEEDENGSDETLVSTHLIGHSRKELLQVPSVQYGKLNGARVGRNKNSKSLTDLQNKVSLELRKDESDDGDIEDESQITIINGIPYRDASGERLQKHSSLTQSQITQDMMNGFGLSHSNVPQRRTRNTANHKDVPRIILEGSKEIYVFPSRDHRANYGRDTDISNLYTRFKKPAVKKYSGRFKYSSDADFSGSEDLPRYKGDDLSYSAKHRMRISSEGNYNHASDFETSLRNRMSNGQFYNDAIRKTNTNRFSGSSINFDPPTEEGHMHRRNVVQSEARHRNRSSPAKVYSGRQGQITSRDAPVGHFPLRNAPQVPSSRTLISLYGANNHPPPQQGMYKRVINIR